MHARLWYPVPRRRLNPFWYYLRDELYHLFPRVERPFDDFTTISLDEARANFADRAQEFRRSLVDPTVGYKFASATQPLIATTA